MLLHVPVVTTIYRALSNVFQSLGNQLQGEHGFSGWSWSSSRTRACRRSGVRDQHAARRDDRPDDPLRLRPDGLMPPAGFTLFVPEESVTDIDWSVNQTLQAILSGGITSPAAIHYFQGLDVARRPARSSTRRGTRSASVGPRSPSDADLLAAVGTNESEGPA